MKLYYAPGACSQAPHIVIHELGLPYEAVKVDLVKHVLPDGTDYRTLNPKGYVPLLALDDGSRLTEVSAILQYLSAQRPGRVAPEFGTRAWWTLVEWIGFVSTEIHKGFGPLWNPATPAEVRERAIQALGNRFGYVEQTLAKQPYLLGQEFTIADAYLFVVLNWAGYHKVDLAPWPALRQFQARMTERPAVQAAFKAEGLVK